METLGLLGKSAIAITLWWMFAKMFYMNEMQRPEKDRVGDHETIQILAVIWPLWAVGIWITFLTGILAALVIGIYGYVVRVSYRLALLYHLHQERKEQRYVDAQRACGCEHQQGSSHEALGTADRKRAPSHSGALA